MVEPGKVVGIVSERDYARKVVLMDVPPATRRCRHHDRPVMFVHPGRTIEECMALMTENRLLHLPVMEAAMIGLVSIGDLVKAPINEQQFIIEQLEQYISGHRE